MSKRILLIIGVLILLLAGSMYLFNPFKNQAVDSNAKPVQTASPTINTSKLTDLTGDWQTYTSPEWGFSMNKPFDVKTELTQNGVHFLKLGETQSTGTELFDGLSLLVFTASLHNKNFEDFVKQEYKKVQNEPINESVSELQQTQVANFSGYRFSAEGIGKSTTYFLKNGTDGYIKITDMTVEPANTKRDVHKTVSQMLNSLQVHTSQTSQDAGASDTAAVNAVKEFAAQDLNVPAGKIVILSVNKKEWPDSCMGLEQEGEMCAEVITPGFEITVQANGKQKIYRTNNDGSIIKIKQ